MKFTSPSGRTYTWDKPEPPTQADIDQLVAYDATLGDDKPKFTASPYGVGGGVATSAETVNKMAPNVVRYGVPLAAGLATGGLGALPAIGTGFASGMGAEKAAQAMEGKDLDTPENRAEAWKAGVLNSPAFGTTARVARTALGIGRLALESAKTGGVMGGTAVAAGVLGEAIKEERAPEIGDIKKALPNAALPMVFGGIMGGGGALAGRLGEVVRENEAIRQWWSDVGSKSPTLAMIHPEWAAFEGKMARGDGGLASQMVEAVPQMTKELFARIGSVPSNAKVARELQNIVPFVDNLSKEVAAADALVQKTAAEYAAAKKAAIGGVAGADELVAKAALERYAAVRDLATAKYKLAHGIGATASVTAHADDMTKTLGLLDDSIKGVSSTLFKATGIDSAQPIVTKGSLAQAAQEALKGSSEESANKILKTISEYGGTETNVLSWDQFRELRSAFSDAFGQNYSDRAEALAGKVYSALKEPFKRGVEQNVGPEALAAYEKASDFWYRWSNVRDGNLGRALFQTPRNQVDGIGVTSGITAATMNGLAEGLLRGDVQAIRSIEQATNVLKEHSPEAAATVYQGVARAIKGNLEAKYIGDTPGMIKALAETARRKDIAPYVEMLGMGNASELNKLARIVRGYDKNSITPGIVAEALKYAKPEIGVARGVMEREIQHVAAMNAAGNRKMAALSLKKVSEEARKAGASQQEVANMLAEARNNPLYAPFEGKGISLATGNGPTGDTISRVLLDMDPDVAHAWMAALRAKNPELAGAISRKVISDELQSVMQLSTDSATSATELNLDKLRRFWAPETPADIQRFEAVKRIAGDAMTKDVVRWFKSYEKAMPLIREGKVSATAAANEALPLSASLAQLIIRVPGLSALGAKSMVGAGLRLAYYPKFKMLTWMATDPQFAKAVAKTQTFAEAMASLPAQRAYMYLSDTGFAKEMALDDQEKKAASNQPPRP